ncbi:S41 family peptidase [Nannocystis pusilla]|uniref:S41 family peptidase n=1 Tax=Nannocystis pusilla TaxID=889268 RepID=UPI003B78D222
MLRGPIDTKVTVKIQRGQETLTLTITRKIIRVDSVTASLLPGKIALLEISTFQENTGEQVRKALADLTPKGEALRGVVLDLRDNSGGLLTQAVEVVDALVAEGELVIVRSALGREAEDAAAEVNLPPDAAVVALINEDSASAAEIVSGGVKALGRGVVVGRPSFGKGTVQLLKPQNLYGRELALKMTIAEYQVAGDTKIQTVGVRPDLSIYPVELSDITAVANYFDTERFERRRESTQVAHLPSAKHEAAFAGKAAGDGPRLRYFAGRQGTRCRAPPRARRRWPIRRCRSPATWPTRWLAFGQQAARRQARRADRRDRRPRGSEDRRRHRRHQDRLGRRARGRQRPHPRAARASSTTRRSPPASRSPCASRSPTAAASLPSAST